MKLLACAIYFIQYYYDIMFEQQIIAIKNTALITLSKN